MNKIKKPVVNLIWHTPDPRRIVAIAGRMTYSAQDVDTIAENLTEEEIARTVNAILERRHYSCLRHVSFCFTISGVSRAFSHQMVRHTAGHNYEQRSQHYRKENEFSLVVPEFNHPLSQRFYEEYGLKAQELYNAMVYQGERIDNARFILPNGVETQLLYTANLNAIVNFIQQRACRLNTPEITEVSLQVRDHVISKFSEMKKYLGPTCLTQGICFEGKKYYKECGRPWKPKVVLWSPKFPASIEFIGPLSKKENENDL